MRPGEAVSLQRMKAWWAYSEVRSLRLTEEYRIDPRVPPLSAKIETLCATSFGFSSVCFGTLSVCVDDAAAQWMTRQLNSRPVHRPVGLAGYRYGTAALSLWFATIQDIESEQDPARLALRNCFIPANTNPQIE